MDFQNKVVLVIGGSSGIGASTAVAFANEGANVVIVGRKEEKMREVSKLCAIKPLLIKADIFKNEEAANVVSETIATYGKLDILVNNAAILRHGRIIDGKIMGSYDEIMNTNVRSLVYITTLAAPHLIKSRGNVINISSVVGISTPTHFLSYGMSKAALNMFSRGAAYEFAAHGVRVNAISPGVTRTDFVENSDIDLCSLEGYKVNIPLNRISEPKEIADLVLFLASDKAKGITGSNFVTDNGYLLAQ